MNKLMILFLMMGFGFCLSAQEKNYTKKTFTKSNEQTLQSVTWYDGDTPKKAWVIPNLVAEFGNSSVAKSFDKSASVNSSHGAVQIWKLNDIGAKENIVRSGGNFSPVYSNDNSVEGTKMALTGKVIVFLKQGTDRAKWASENGVKIAQNLSFGNGLVILSNPNDAISLANSLRSNSQVQSSQPDWWIQAEAK